MPTLDEVLAAIAVPVETPRPGAHSPLYEVLWTAFDALAPHLDPPRRPHWDRVAAGLAAKGVLDGIGNPPTADRTRKAWWQVNRDKAAIAAGTVRRRRGRVPNQTVSPTAVATAGTFAAAPTQRSLPVDEDGEMDLSRFFHNGPKKWT